jgi:hypothetical protein
MAASQWGSCLKAIVNDSLVSLDALKRCGIDCDGTSADLLAQDRIADKVGELSWQIMKYRSWSLGSYDLPPYVYGGLCSSSQPRRAACAQQMRVHHQNLLLLERLALRLPKAWTPATIARRIQRSSSCTPWDFKSKKPKHLSDCINIHRDCNSYPDSSALMVSVDSGQHDQHDFRALAQIRNKRKNVIRAAQSPALRGMAKMRCPPPCGTASIC